MSLALITVYRKRSTWTSCNVLPGRQRQRAENPLKVPRCASRCRCRHYYRTPARLWQQWRQVRIDSSTVLKQSIIIGSEENRCDAEVDLKHTWKSCHTFQFNVELLAIAHQLLQLNITAKGKLRFVLGFQRAKYWSGPTWQYREEWWNSILTDNFG